MIYVVPWLFITVHCSGPCSLLPERLLLFSQNSAKYCGVSQLQKNNPKILEYFEFGTSSDKLLVQKEKLWCSWRFQNNVSTFNLFL